MSVIDVWVLERDRVDQALARLLAGRTRRVGPNGKPEADGIHFNVSHSGALALIALCADSPVGVDLEAPRRLRRAPRIARRVCSARELEHLDALGSGAFDAGFLRLWVRKEAVAKADGRGIGMLLDTRVDVLDPLVAGGWLLADLPEPAPGHIAALAWRADR